MVFSLLVLAIPANTQQPLVALIQGNVVDQKRQPVPYASLTATNIDSVEPESHGRNTGAGEKGFYQFVDVPEGRYSIIVKKKGFRDYHVLSSRCMTGRTFDGCSAERLYRVTDSCYAFEDSSGRRACAP